MVEVKVPWNEGAKVPAMVQNEPAAGLGRGGGVLCAESLVGLELARNWLRGAMVVLEGLEPWGLEGRVAPFEVGLCCYRFPFRSGAFCFLVV